MADPTEVGKFGTIRLLKQRVPAGVVAAYPIDDDEVSFGRDSNCSVRLYYPEVSPLHCKIIFEERKAILQVFGANGVVVDGCPVYPAKPAALGMAPTTVSVPLPNNSVFEIHKKRFVFNYPPKALRPQLFTPAADRRKSVRMSLVHCAQVFSPAPSPYPRDNLRVLQSPVKLSNSDAPVTLVKSDRPRVYEEEQDLVILEDMDEKAQHPPSPTPARVQPPPRTPRRSMPSLHRAVLIRSAQRNAFMREESHRQRAVAQPQFTQINLDEEDAEGEIDEEDEVVNSILDVSGESDEGEKDTSSADTKQADGDGNPFTEDMPIDEQDITETAEEDQSMSTEGDGVPEEARTPAQIGPIRPLGSFMTPQPQLFAQRPPRELADRRRTGPQRPPPGYLLNGDASIVIKEESQAQKMDEIQHRAHTSPTKRPEVTEEERRAILERRKSALAQPDFAIGDGFLSKQNEQPKVLPTPSYMEQPGSPFKALSKDIDEGEDTQVILKRMETQLAQRRASLSPTRPRISHGVGGGPSSPEKFSLLAPAARLLPFAGMIKREDESGDVFNKADSMEVDHEANSSSTGTTRSAEQQSDDVFNPPRTPEFTGLRTMFGRPQEPQGLETPAVQGVRNLFREPHVPQTPQMEGVRQLFTQPKVPPTPAFDGIADMMPVDQDNTREASGSRSTQLADVPEDIEEEDEEDSRPTKTNAARKPPSNSRTVSRRGMTKMAATPSDLSTMADDEATPDGQSAPLPRGLRGAGSVPEGAVVHRTGRSRRAVSSTQITANDDTPEVHTKRSGTSPKRGRQVRIKAEEGPTELSKPPSKDSTVRIRTARTRTESSATESNAEGSTAKPPSRSRRTVSGSADQQQQSESGPARRSTRARSRSADPGSDVDTGPPTNKAQKKSATMAVETIHENEELSLPEPDGDSEHTRRPPSNTATRARRTRTETGNSVGESAAEARKRAPPSSAGASKRSTRSTHADSNTEDAANTEDKENTPEHSPTSESGDGSSEGKKGATKGRGPTASKVPVSSRTRATTTASKAPAKKPPSRTVKAKASEESVGATRTTRTRKRT